MKAVNRILAIVSVACAAPATVSLPPVQPAVAAANVASTPDAEAIVTRTNGERARLGLSQLARSARLMKAAQLQAEQMAATKTMAHTLTGVTYPTPDSRLQAVGYPWWASAENVAEGYTSAEAVVAGWMTSPGHRANIVSGLFTEMGGGVATGSNGRRYYAQVFGKPR